MSIENFVNKKYEAGFVTDIESEVLQKGLNEHVIKYISEKNKEPDWLLKFRLRAFSRLQKIKQPKSLKQKLGLGITSPISDELFMKIKEELMFNKFGL